MDRRCISIDQGSGECGMIWSSIRRNYCSDRRRPTSEVVRLSGVDLAFLRHCFRGCFRGFDTLGV